VKWFNDARGTGSLNRGQRRDVVRATVFRNQLEGHQVRSPKGRKLWYCCLGSRFSTGGEKGIHVCEPWFRALETVHRAATNERAWHSRPPLSAGRCAVLCFQPMKGLSVVGFCVALSVFVLFYR
jgi:hypothetical protein